MFELYYVPMLFLSGQVFPISLLPDWARGLALLFPSDDTTDVAIETAVGRLRGVKMWTCIGLQVLWIVVSYLAHRLLWRYGLRHYTGVGMERLHS